MSGGPSLLYSRIWRWRGEKAKLIWVWYTWVGLIGNSFTWGAVNSPLLGEPPVSVSLWLFRSPREALPITSLEGLGIAAILFGNEMGRQGWGKYLRVHVVTQSQFSLQYSLPHKLCWVPHAETYILYNIFRECIFRYVSSARMEEEQMLSFME